MPYQLVISVGAASSAAQPASFLTTSPWLIGDQRQVDAHRGGEHLAHGVGGFVDAHRVVEHVAEVRAHFLRHQVAVHARELRQDVLHRRHGEAQLGEFALELVELDDRVAAVGLGEDVLLELVQLVAELGDDRQVVVDDEVEDRVQRRRTGPSASSSGSRSTRARTGAYDSDAPWRTVTR